MTEVTFHGITYDASHGGPFDRGCADSYYRRRHNPHYMKNGKEIKLDQLTAKDIAEYSAGYDYNNYNGSHKEY